MNYQSNPYADHYFSYREAKEAREYSDVQWMVLVKHRLPMTAQQRRDRARAMNRTVKHPMTIQSEPHRKLFYGPFATEEEAMEWGETWKNKELWTTVPLFNPDIEYPWD